MDLLKPIKRLIGYDAELAVARHAEIQKIRQAVLAAWSGSIALDVRRAEAGPVYSQPILQITQRSFGAGAQHETQLLLFHAMRQYYPTLAAVIHNRRVLEGDIYAVSEDQALADALNEWAEQVTVGYVSGRAAPRGLNNYLDLMAENADEYGLSAGEIVTDEQGREVIRLVVPNPRTLSMRDTNNDGIYELYQAQGQRGSRRIDDSPLVQTLTFSATSEHPWPVPLAWPLVKTTEAVLRMYESVINGWWQFGDPSLAVRFNYDKDASPATTTATQDGKGADVPVEVLMFKEGLEAVMAARRQGKVGHVYGWSTGGSVEIDPLGGVDATMMRYFREQSHYFDGIVVGASDTPAWLYPHLESRGEGLGSGRSNNQALIASTAAYKRNAEKVRLAREVFDTYLLLSGDARYIGKYDLEADAVSLLDDRVMAETRKLFAEAEAQEIENAAQLYDEDGAPRFAGEAYEYLKRKEVLP